MNLLNNKIEQKIRNDIIDVIVRKEYDLAIHNIPKIIDQLYANIPDDKRISYGIVHTIKVLSQYLYAQLIDLNAPVYQIASNIFNKSEDFKSKAVSLGMLSFYGLDDFEKVFPYFKTAAAFSNWEVREMAQMFFRKLIKKHPEKAKENLLQLVKSEDSNIRRFVAETLRPVQENRWFYKNSDYSLSVLRVPKARKKTSLN